MATLNLSSLKKHTQNESANVSETNTEVVTPVVASAKAENDTVSKEIRPKISLAGFKKPKLESSPEPVAEATAIRENNETAQEESVPAESVKLEMPVIATSQETTPVVETVAEVKEETAKTIPEKKDGSEFFPNLTIEDDSLFSNLDMGLEEKKVEEVATIEKTLPQIEEKKEEMLETTAQALSPVQTDSSEVENSQLIAIKPETKTTEALEEKKQYQEVVAKELSGERPPAGIKVFSKVHYLGITAFAVTALGLLGLSFFLFGEGGNTGKASVIETPMNTAIPTPPEAPEVVMANTGSETMTGTQIALSTDTGSVESVTTPETDPINTELTNTGTAGTGSTLTGGIVTASTGSVGPTVAMNTGAVAMANTGTMVPVVTSTGTAAQSGSVSPIVTPVPVKNPTATTPPVSGSGSVKVRTPNVPKKK